MSVKCEHLAPIGKNTADTLPYLAPGLLRTVHFNVAKTGFF